MRPCACGNQLRVWSFCNEGGCGAGSNHTLGSAFRDMAYQWDGSRKVSGNMRGEIGPGTLSDIIDVQGPSPPPVADTLLLQPVEGIPR